MRMLHLAFLCIAFFPLKAQYQSEKNTELDAFIRQGLEDWGGLGLSVVVVKGGETIFNQGYGRARLDSDRPVDANTLMAMGSTTKAVTALAIGMLVDEGKVHWDDKVVQHLPWFKVADPWITRELTVRDLLTHRAGFGNADFLWTTAEWSAREILERMQYAETVYPFRSGYIYQNIMYAAAGELIHELSGMPWEDFLVKRIFKPLGMTRTYPFYRDVENMENVVLPHDKVNGKLSIIPMVSADAIGSAGSLMSCTNDMAIWMKFLLNEGAPLLEAQTYRELFTPQIVIPQGSFYPTTALTNPSWTTYGLGWFQHDYMGKMLNFHTGSLPGLIAICGLLQSDDFGVYVLGNTDHIELRHAIMYKAIDLFVTEGERDWHREIFDLYKGLQEQSDRAVATNKRLPLQNTKPSLPLQAYAGVYTHPMRGEALVEVLNGELQVTLNNKLKLVLEHRHVDVFQSVGAEQFFRFSWNEKKQVTAVYANEVKWVRQ